MENVVFIALHEGTDEQSRISNFALTGQDLNLYYIVFTQYTIQFKDGNRDCHRNENSGARQEENWVGHRHGNRDGKGIGRRTDIRMKLGMVIAMEIRMGLGAGIKLKIAMGIELNNVCQASQCSTKFNAGAVQIVLHKLHRL